MYYSSFGILAVFLHLIINFDALKNGRKEPHEGANFRYRQFLNSILVFYVVDSIWGFLTETKIIPLIYADTVLFFVMVCLSVLLWTRFVVAFLDKNGIRAKSFLAAGWGIFGFTILTLIINFFNPIIFFINDDGIYVPGNVRNLIMVVQFLLYILITVYSFFVSFKLTGREQVHYRAVCSSGGVMALLILLQTFHPFAPFYTIGCFIANCIMHVFVEEDEKREQDRITENYRKEMDRYSQIANSLANDYEAIYFINIETGKYLEISVSEEYKSLEVPKRGEDFFEETRENAKRYAHPDDRDFAVSMYYKEVMLKNLEGRNSYSYKYRIMVGDQARYFRFVVMLSEDKKHLVLCDKDIQDTITAETALKEKQKAVATFTQIAESLASNYDVIYYVDMVTEEYVGYTSHNIYGELEINESGDDFFNEAKKNAAVLIHPQDKERLLSVLNKDYLLSMLEGRKQISVEYRHIVEDKELYTRMTARKTSDGGHVIIGVENIDEEVRRENEQIQALKTEQELARRDELTGVRNKMAFSELEESVQRNLDKGMDYLPFSIVVCDLNDLKLINDTMGHKAGDDYIKDSVKLLCDVFKHSPVFRIGGDEFVIFLSGVDYSNRQQLVDSIRGKIMSNHEKNDGPVIAVGISDYVSGKDISVSDIFERADKQMYTDKRRLKAVI